MEWIPDLWETRILHLTRTGSRVTKGTLCSDWEMTFRQRFMDSQLRASARPRAIPLQNGTHEANTSQMQQFQRIQPSTSADVLAAASTLVRNGQSQLSQGRHRSEHSLMHSMDNTFMERPSDLYGSHFSTLPQNGIQSSGFRAPYRNSMPNTVDDPLLHAIMFGGATQQSQSRRKTVDFRYGSDVSFLDNRYAPPPGQETEDQVTKDLMQKMECLEPQNSATNTRPPTPGATASRQTDTLSKAKRTSISGLDITEDDETVARPKKRRKSSVKQEAPPSADDINGTSHESHADTRTSPRKSRGRKSSTTTSTSNIAMTSTAMIEDSPSKRRKSTSGINRENLSEEQKRNNHILSEQKRRNIIKQGFDDLCELVPELRDGAFSKSAMLTQAGDWLEDLLKGNEELRSKLGTLG